VTRLYTIGYERLLPAELVHVLELAGVRRLIDVRYRPQSRRPGMSKTRLAELLGDREIAYEHRKALGTPPDIRWLYRSGRTDEARAAFLEHVERTAFHELDAFARELAQAPATALMCLEADPAGCHRRVLAEALRRRRPKLEVVDL